MISEDCLHSLGCQLRMLCTCSHSPTITIVVRGWKIRGFYSCVAPQYRVSARAMTSTPEFAVTTVIQEARILPPVCSQQGRASNRVLLEEKSLRRYSPMVELEGDGVTND